MHKLNVKTDNTTRNTVVPFGENLFTNLKKRDLLRINNALIAIANAVNTSTDLDALYAEIHRIMGTIFDATNFYIALVELDKNRINFPYFADSRDNRKDLPIAFPDRHSLTALVVSEARPLLLKPDFIEDYAARGAVRGSKPLIWMGAPLMTEEKILGVQALQSYTNPNAFNENDLRIFYAICQQTAIAIDRKTAIEKLKKSEKTYRKLFLDAQIGLARLDLNGNVTDCNNAMAAMVGFEKREQALDYTCLVKKCLYEANRQEFKALLKSGEKIVNEVIPLKRRDGTTIWIKFSARMDKNTGIAEAVVEDISALKKANDEKQALQEKLLRAQKLETVGLLAGGVAHDLNNILSGVIGYPELLLMGIEAEDPMKQPLEEILEAGKRAAAVVADLLGITRSVNQKKEVLDLNELLATLCASADCVQTRNRHPEVTVVHEIEATDSLIYGSASHIQRAIMNLGTNGMEAITGPGRLTFRTFNNAAAGTVILSVTDTGPGIDGEDLERIFEPFYTRKNMGRSGSGLGLTVVWNTMKEHNGEVRIKTGADGSTFSIHFPLYNDTVTRQETAPDVLQGGKETLLVVDDEPVVREIARLQLQALGYTVNVVESGEKALDYIKEKDVDLVILDMQMPPGISGRETYEKILEIKPAQRAILATGYASETEIAACRKLGIREIIDKPFNQAGLSQGIRKELDGNHPKE